MIETPIYADSEQLVDAYCNPIQNAVVIISNKNEKEVIHTPQSASNENFNLCKIDNVDPLFFEVGKAIIEKDKVSIGMYCRGRGRFETKKNTNIV